MTGVENSTRAHSSPSPPLQKWFKTGLYCKYCSQSSIDVVLYNCIVLYPTIRRKGGGIEL